MRRKLGFKKTLRQSRLDSLSAQSYYAAMMPVDDPRRAENMQRLEQEREDIGEVRKRAAPVQREAPVVAAISELLARHPLVAIAVRQNSGMASYEAKSGRYAPVHFYKLLTHASTQTIVDFWGLLKDGRMFAFEAKAPGWSHPHNDREYKQANFINTVRNCGGIGGFVTDAQQVAEALG